jgi:hypothetical protein
LKEKTMRRILTHTALSMALALSLCAPAALAKGKKHKKYSAEHYTAVNKCRDDYKAAKKEADTKKGKERKEALEAARTARKQCMDAAPK